MSVKTAYSTLCPAERAAGDIYSQLQKFDPKMVIFFASSAFDQAVLSQKLQECFPSAVTFGCSTAGEIISGKMLKNSVVAMAFDEETISGVKVEVVENIKEDGDVKKAFASFEKYYGEPARQMDYKKYTGIVLIDGLSMSEEKIMERIGDTTNVVFVGGSAGDDLKFEKTYVCAGGKAYTNAAVLALLKPKTAFDFIKTQSFDVLNKKLVATKVIPEKREVVEFNGKPAAVAYAEALGVSVKEAANFFMTHPLGLVAEDEIFVRSPQKITGNSMVFYCNILEGMEVYVLQDRDIVGETWSAIKSKKRRMGQITGIINFNCILRTLELEQNGETGAYAGLFSEIPTIGFSTYGEAFQGHINQTATMLVFK
ncbi:uncharacterized conserved protein [Pelotomaculum thermopropionicum SI]|uniref:Uncharacterized conserved protein n=1 Tax=Pelotomaculum thermopropionicum (strain DSM 13744 / JCM 10971 / SI) TaxID=370438 RepID=A5D020_PELTS|nr:uncharacterized conserved protein [Pelotomaculum thermopropionicum SI]